MTARGRSAVPSKREPTGRSSLLNASGWIQYSQFHINLRVFLYGLTIAGLFGLVSGVYPAWRMSRLNPVQALKGASR